LVVESALIRSAPSGKLEFSESKLRRSRRLYPLRSLQRT
jgi:hypothetical protein